MYILSVILVLASGISHAVWNLLAKRSDNKSLFLFVIFVPATIMLLPTTIADILKPGIPPQGFLLLVLSLLIQGGYAFFLSRAYMYGDMSHAYPMMRGVSAFLLPVASMLLFDETLSVWGWLGLALIAGGFSATSGLNVQRRKKTIPLKVVLLTLGVGLCTMSYVLVDKANLRYFSPIVLLEVSNIGFMMGLAPFVRFREIDWKREWKNHRWVLAAGSILSPGSYLLFLFAMKLAPLTYVAPLREIGTVFGTAAAIYLLKEKKEIVRMVSACVIFAGILIVGIWGM